MGGGSHSNEQQAQQQPQQQTQQQMQPCQNEAFNFSNCLQTNSDIASCQFYSDVLKSCKANNNVLWSKLLNS